MTWHLFWLLIAVTGALTAGFIPGHKFGRRSCRNEYPDGWDAGQAAERERWEQATGTTWDALAGWQSRRQPEPDLEGGWQEPPPTDVLMKEAVRQGFTERVPSVAEVDDLAAQWEVAQRPSMRPVASPITPETLRAHIEALGGTMEPIVADLTGAAAWHYPGEDDVPTLTGLIVTDPRRTGPEWLETLMAAQDSETAAWLRRTEAEMALFRRGITAGSTR